MKNVPYAIGIMTYSKRRTFISDLLSDIRSVSEIPVYLAVNADYQVPFDDDYRKFILELCASYKHVYASFYLTFRGSSKLWNDMIINTSADNLIIMNDDARVKNTFLHDLIAHKESTDNNKILKVNNGWACFCVNKEFIKSVGFFNEKYLGIGFEDMEFVRRVSEFPSFHSEDFVDLNFESVSTFPKMENVFDAHKKSYSSYNHNLIQRNEVGDEGKSFRPYEDIYDKNFDQIF